MTQKKMLGAFFLSGMSALIYEVVWSRILSLIFGASVYGQSIVLALFMGGLSLGANLAGKKCSHFMGSPLTFYALLEGVVGLFGLASTSLVSLCFPISTHSVIFDFILRFFTCAVVILPASMAMGGTFPVLYKALSHRADSSESTLTQVSRLYVVNTLGAFVGIALSSYWLLFSFGIQHTLFLAASLNFILFLFFVKDPSFIQNTSPIISVTSSPSPLNPTTLWALFVCGMATMIYEVSWSRALCFSFGSSIYTFALILLAFLGGLTLGAFWIDYKKTMPSSQLHSYLCDLQTRISIGAAVFTFVSLRLPLLTEKLFYFAGGVTWKVHLLEGSLLFLMMTPVAFFIGASFPILCAILTNIGKPTESQIGIGYSVNTLGAIFGAMLTGFMLVPNIGPFNTLWVALSLHVIVMILVAPKPKIQALSGNILMMMGVMVFLWAQLQSVNSLDLLAGYYSKVYQSKHEAPPEYLANNPAFSRGLALMNPGPSEAEVLWFKHGVTSSVAVVKNKFNTRLVINGKTDASVGEYFQSDMPTQSFLALLPLLYSKKQDQGLVVGLGSGVTTGILSLNSKQVDCLEIEKRVLEAAPYFKEFNFDVRNRKNVQFIVDDARKVIRNSENFYDFISSEPSNVWVSGVAQLFTKEYFEDCKRILVKDGVMVQWVHIYKLSCEDLKIIVRTFASVFPSMQIWGSFNYGDLFLVGFKNKQPLELSPERFSDFLKMYCYSKEMTSMGAETLEKFLKFRLYSGIYLGSPFPLNTDDRPILEYSAGKNMFSLESKDIFDWIAHGLSNP